MPRAKRNGSTLPPARERAKDSEEMSKDLTQYVTTAKAAQMMGVDRTQAALLVKTGKIRGFKPGHDWLIFVPSIRTYVESKSKRGRPPSRTPQVQGDQLSGQG